MTTPPPGPSRPYQCPQCPSKFDTMTQLQCHLTTCTGMMHLIISDTDDSSSNVTSSVVTNINVVKPTGRSIKTDNVSAIKSNVSNVYVRFVQTYYSSYKRKFPDLSSTDLIQKLSEGYRLLRSNNHPSIRKLQEEYDKDRREIVNSKIRTIVKCLEEEGCADFQINI